MKNKRLCAGCLLLGLLSMPAWPVDRLALTMDSLEGDGWRARDIQWQLNLDGSPGSRVQVARLELPAPYGNITALDITCTELVLEARRVECVTGKATAQAEWLGEAPFPVSFRYTPATRALALKVAGMPAFGGQFSLDANYASGWEVSAQVKGIQARQLHDWLPVVEALNQDDSFRNWQFAGPLDGSLRYAGGSAKFTFKTSGLTFSDSQGRYASENLAVELTGSLQRHARLWQGRASIRVDAGQAYVEPVFADLSAYPGQVDVKAAYGDDGLLVVETLELTQPGVLQARTSGRWSSGDGFDDLSIQISKAQLPAGYEIYAKPFLAGTSFDALQTAGSFSGELQWTAAGFEAVHMRLDGVVLEDDKQRFALDALQGEIHWQERGEPQITRLQWAGGAAYKVLFGAAEVQLQAHEHNAHLVKPLILPLMEGALRVNQLDVLEWGGEQMTLIFDGELEPLNLEELTTALGWPRFGGSLAGRLPALNYRAGVVTLGGPLTARVFDGEVSVENLRIQDPFGRLPQMFADLRLRNLDLEAVTRAFSFGRIEGRLNGDVEQLQMLRWQPVAFDARLVTPEDDDSRRRISQRAIENISAIGGGGASAALSAGFLRFFEEFAYDRIGISCRLSGGVCHMGGLGPSADGQGYVLVKGRLLPRIDVIGHAREVDWATLVEQLKTVTEGEGPVVR